MKKAVLSIALASVLSTSALASGGAARFTGRYTVDKSNCDNLLLVRSDRVYIGFDTARDGTRELVISGYGDEASQDTILLGHGARQVPGTSVESHGITEQSWTTTIRGGSLVSVVKVSRPSIRYSNTSVTRLKLHGELLELGTEYRSSKGQVDTTYCRLERD